LAAQGSARTIVTAWVLTIPGAAPVAAVCYRPVAGIV